MAGKHLVVAIRLQYHCMFARQVPASKLLQPLATLFDQGELKLFALMLYVQTVKQVHHIYIEIWI